MELSYPAYRLSTGDARNMAHQIQSERYQYLTFIISWLQIFYQMPATGVTRNRLAGSGI